jgi:hypothetical protein
MICNECETVAHCTKHGCVPKQPAPVQWWPKTEDQPIDNGPDYEDGPDEEGFSGPRPWNGFAQSAPVQEQIESAKQIWREDQQRIAELSAEIDRLTAAQRQWVGLTDEEENALIPDPDGSAEANVRRVEVLPGAWGKEYEEVDAWSKPLVLQMLRDHEAKLKEKNNG